MDAVQPGTKQVAAAYALYSSATMLVASWGAGVHGFTLDRGLGEFVLTHPYMQIPKRGEPLPCSNVFKSYMWPSIMQGQSVQDTGVSISCANEARLLHPLRNLGDYRSPAYMAPCAPVP